MGRDRAMVCYQNCYHPKKTRGTTDKKKPLQINDLRGFFCVLAGWTGLEPAASGVTGRRSNQLNYHPSRKGTRSGRPRGTAGTVKRRVVRASGHPQSRRSIPSPTESATTSRTGMVTMWWAVQDSNL